MAEASGMIPELHEKIDEAASRLRTILDEHNTELYQMSEDTRTELGYLLQYLEGQ